MGSVVNVNPNPDGLVLVIDGRNVPVAQGASVDVPDEKVAGLLEQTENWGAAKAPVKPAEPVATEGEQA